MTIKNYSALIIFLFSVSSQTMAINKSIYGTDDRREADQFTSTQVVQQIRGTVAMVNKNFLTLIPELDSYRFNLSPIGETQKLCKEEKFYNQHNIADCSGFLAAPDIIVTAGHCVRDQEDCSNNRWVFDYTHDTNLLNKNNVYKCSKILERDVDKTFFSYKDYAVIQLDRPVTDRAPLKIRTFGRITKGTDLRIVGHPSGLPTKVANNAKVKRWNLKEKIDLPTRVQTFFRRVFYFSSNLDAFIGNSGSPVINVKTGKVEGILVEGGKDYEYNYERKCQQVKKRSDHHDGAEELTFKITKIKRLKSIIRKHTKKFQQDQKQLNIAVKKRIPGGEEEF